MGKRIGIRDVADAAQVSIGTVSSVLNDKQLHRFSPTTQERVRAAADRLGYRPNKVARALRTTETTIIGMVSDLVATTPYAGELISGAQAEAADAGHVLVLVNAERGTTERREGTSALLQYRVQALVYADVAQRVTAPPEVVDDVPLVFANQIEVGGTHPCVVADERKGARDAVALLVARGHRRIAFVGPTSDLLGPTLRREGYLEAMANAGLEAEAGLLPPVEQFSAVAGRAATASLLTSRERPTAVLAASDQIAVGVYQSAARAGLAVPEDLSVVGFGNWPLIAPELDPPLTTVALPYHEIGRRAVRLALHPRLDDAGPVLLLPTSLVVGGSVGPAR